LNEDCALNYPSLRLSFLFSLALLSACDRGAAPEPVPSVRIGAVLPLTGNSAVWGVPTREGAELAADLINSSGGIVGRRIELIVEDSAGDPKTALSAVEKLLSVDKVVAVLDNSNSAVTLAIAPTMEKNHRVLLVTGASSPLIRTAGDYIFRIWNSDSLEGELMARYLSRSGHKRTAVLYVNNSYGDGLRTVFKTAYEALGAKVIAEETFLENEADFRTQATRVIASDAEAIYIIAYPKQGAILLRQLHELHNRKPLYGAVAFEDTAMLQAAGEAAEGLTYPLPAPVDPNAAAFRKFADAYKAKYHKDVPFLADVGFDGLNVLATALRNEPGESPERIKHGLYTLPAYDGVSGQIVFDADGEVHKPFGMRIVRAGTAQWLEPRVD
jgi:branched-chain amino acid transport system substrate-binding protein